MSDRVRLPAGPVVVTPALLQDRPLPAPGSVADKEQRGCVVVVGGSAQTPGGVLLAGLAALRAGAGKLQLATAASVATSLAVTVPEARVVPLSEGADGVLRPSDELERLVGSADAVLVGTGALGPDPVAELFRSVVASLGERTAIVVDAGALAVLADEPDLLRSLAERAVVMPNPTEAAVLLGATLEDVTGDVERAHDDLLERLGCVVALRSPVTYVAGPGSSRYLDSSGHPALGTSGSGDVLAGVLTGLLARGAGPLDAALWAAHLHGRAGEQAAVRIGGQGILARELVDEVPRALVAVSGVTT